jgi:TIR domain
MDAQVTDSDKNIAISVPLLLHSGAEYFAVKPVLVQVTNRWPHPILIEDVTLRFRSESGADVFVDKHCGVRVSADELIDLSVDVQPTASYQEHTNYFDVQIHYRRELNGQLENTRLRARQPLASFLIITRPKDTLGSVFISFRQPGDLPWAVLLERYAHRAGLDPYVVVHDPQPGTDQWDRIEAEIKRSNAVCVIWGERTEWSDGVKKEIELCRTHSVREVLLLAENVSRPDMFTGKIEYMTFDPNLPNDGFAKAVEAIRSAFLRAAS